MHHILIADPDPNHRHKLKAALADQYIIHEASNSLEAMDAAERENISLFVVDSRIKFPEGQNLLSRYRNSVLNPIIHYGVPEESTNGIGQNDDMGASYFDADRLKRGIDRLKGRFYGESDDPASYRYHDLTIDYTTGRVLIRDKDVKITQKEYDLFLYLLMNQGEHFSREDLLQKIWGYQFGGSRTVDTHIKSLRKKIGDYRSLILTIWRKGYKIEIPVD
jgi:DNA-binding response OmpR family regulator